MYYTQEQLKETIWDLVTEHGSQKAVAELLKIKPAYLNDILHDKRAISDHVAKQIGYFRQTVFTKV